MQQNVEKFHWGAGKYFCKAQYTPSLQDELDRRFAAVSLIPGSALSWLWQLFLPAVSQHYCQDAVEKRFVLLALVQLSLWFQAPPWSLKFSVLSAKQHPSGDEKKGIHNVSLYSYFWLCGAFSTLYAPIAFWEEYWTHSQFSRWGESISTNNCAFISGIASFWQEVESSVCVCSML